MVMQSRRTWYGIGMLAAVLVCASALAAEPSVKGDYKTPTFVIPYCRVKPKIDGVVGEEEWQGAMSVRALQTVRRTVSPRQTRFWAMWDEDNLYIAMRSPLRKGERVIQARRRREREVNVVFDDSYEVWLDVGARSPDGMDCFVQFLCNFAGARYDALHLPTVGNWRLTYNTDWEPVNRITADNAWEWELVIPRASLYKTTPFADGFEMRSLLARNYKRPWEQNSVEGTSSFSVSDSYTKWVLSKSAPAIHLLGIGDPVAGTFGLNLAACGQGDEALKWSFESDGGVKKEGALAVKKGKLAAAAPGLNLDKAGEGHFRVRVTSADGKKTYLDWCSQRAYGDVKILAQEINDPNDRVDLNVSLNPIKDYVKVVGDFINYDARDKIDRCHLQVFDAANRTLAEEDLKIDELAYVDGIFHLGKLAPGRYSAKITCVGKDGKAVLERDAKFEKKNHAKAFKWWNTKAGSIEKVISPWTPVDYARNEFSVWGRTMSVGACGLPAQITSQGKDLLAAPAYLVAEDADGKRLTAEAVGRHPVVTARADHRSAVRATGQVAGLDVSSDVSVEFDGMYKIVMTVTPKKPVTLKSLKLTLPLKNEVADYVHACGEGIRYGFYYGGLPAEKKGRIWDCTTVDSQPMLVGSFIPYVWVGNTKGGLCWSADSDEGWVPNDKVPAIEIRRDSDKSTDLVLNLISSEFTLDKPRKITFAFQATPVKPLHKQWRMDSWWCGDTFRDYSGTGVVIWHAIPFTKDVEKCKQMVQAQKKAANSFIFGVDKYCANAVPYFIHQTLPAHLVPEVGYFGDQWKTSISECLFYGKTLTDYMIHNLADWSKQTGIEGYYIDNMRPVACDNIDAGRGYRLPDGRIQPTYQMFSTRRYFLRMRAAFLEGVGHSKVVLHMTNNMIIPWVGAADVAYDGEHHVIYPEMGKDFMDFWSLERMRVDYSQQWGVVVNFMHEYQGNWDKAAMVKAMRAYSGLVGLHDALPSGNANALNQPFWIGRDRFGIEGDDVRFIGYWDKDKGVKSETKDVYVAVWSRPGSALLLVVNKGEKADAVVQLDAKKLALPDPASWELVDAEHGTKVEVWDPKARTRVTAWDSAAHGAARCEGGGKVVVPVERHDYRQIIVRKKAD